MDILKRIDFYLQEKKSTRDKLYDNLFKKMLKKYGVKSPAELSKEEKIKFFSELDRLWKAEDE